MTLRLILASASPRRREILKNLGVQFSIIETDIDESFHDGESCEAYVLRLAQAKARVGAERAGEERAYVLGADTTVVVDEESLGKPRDFDDHASMMKKMSGRWHAVMTGVALASKQDDSVALVENFVSATRVHFRSLTDSEIENYVRSGEGRDKAGGYAIQGLGAGIVLEIAGSYTNVVGLPAAETLVLLKKIGVVSSWP